jgi:hypothetical protein
MEDSICKSSRQSVFEKIGIGGLGRGESSMETRGMEGQGEEQILLKFLTKFSRRLFPHLATVCLNPTEDSNSQGTEAPANLCQDLRASFVVEIGA